MSHIAVQATKPGEPMFSDLKALEAACNMLGLAVQIRSNYTWFNRHVGDYPMPPGVTHAELGHNAKFVLTLNAEMRAKHGVPGREPYEIGVVEDANNPGCYVPMYDFYAGGFGLEAVVGRALFHDGRDRQVKMLCPLLKQKYEMCADALAAQAVGDRITFMTLAKAREAYPKQFAAVAVNDEEAADTWVSVADTSARVEESVLAGY